MSSFDAIQDRLQDVLTNAMGAARAGFGAIAQSATPYDQRAEFLDVIRRHRLDMDHAARQTLAAFRVRCDDPLPATDLQHHLDCLRQDVEEGANYAKAAGTKLHELFLAAQRPGGTDEAAAKRHLEEYSLAIGEDVRRGQVVTESCRRTLEGARKACAAADRAPASLHHAGAHEAPEKAPGDTKPQAEEAKGGDPPGGESAPNALMTWQEAGERLLGLRRKGDPWTSCKKMGKELGCSPATVHKAVRQTRELHPWAKAEADPQGAGPQ